MIPKNRNAKNANTMSVITAASIGLFLCSRTTLSMPNASPAAPNTMNIMLTTKYGRNIEKKYGKAVNTPASTVKISVSSFFFCSALRRAYSA